MKKIFLALSFFTVLNSVAFAQNNESDARRTAAAMTEKMSATLGLSEDQKVYVMEINMALAEYKMQKEITTQQKEEFEKRLDVKYQSVLNEKQYAKYLETYRNAEKPEKSK